MVPTSTITALKANHARMLHGATEVAMRSLFESSLKTLGEESRIHLVIILDELDDALLSLSPWPFRSLRALRDEWQGRLTYVFSTSRRLERIKPDASLYEFREMSHANTLMLRPLSPSDALICLHELLQNCQLELDELQQKVVLTLAGGHPGFIKRIALTIPQVLPQPSTDEDWVQRLQSLWAIQQESQHLWDELEVEEQDALLAYTTTGLDHLDDLQRRSLESRGLLASDQAGKLMIFNPLFNIYLLNRLTRLRNMDTRGVQCDFDSGKIWVDGKDITLELSDLQRKLLRFMYQRANTVCTYQEIREAVWGAGEGITTSAIYELIKRSREKLGDSTLNPQHLVTVRGEGCMLKLPD
jgi:hypothetical protein